MKLKTVCKVVKMHSLAEQHISSNILRSEIFTKIIFRPSQWGRGGATSRWPSSPVDGSQEKSVWLLRSDKHFLPKKRIFWLLQKFNGYMGMLFLSFLVER